MYLRLKIISITKDTLTLQAFQSIKQPSSNERLRALETIGANTLKDLIQSMQPPFSLGEIRVASSRGLPIDIAELVAIMIPPIRVRGDRNHSGQELSPREWYQTIQTVLYAISCCHFDQTLRLFLWAKATLSPRSGELRDLAKTTLARMTIYSIARLDPNHIYTGNPGDLAEANTWSLEKRILLLINYKEPDNKDKDFEKFINTINRVKTLLWRVRGYTRHIRMGDKDVQFAIQEQLRAQRHLRLLLPRFSLSTYVKTHFPDGLIKPPANDIEG